MIYLTEVGAFDEAAFRKLEASVCGEHVKELRFFEQSFEMARWEEKDRCNRAEAREYW